MLMIGAGVAGNTYMPINGSLRYLHTRLITNLGHTSKTVLLLCIGIVLHIIMYYGEVEG